MSPSAFLRLPLWSLKRRHGPTTFAFCSMLNALQLQREPLASSGMHVSAVLILEQASKSPPLSAIHTYEQFFCFSCSARFASAYSSYSVGRHTTPGWVPASNHGPFNAPFKSLPFRISVFYPPRSFWQGWRGRGLRRRRCRR